MDYFSSNPIHTQDLALTFINEDEEEDASSPLDSPLEASSEDSSKGWAQMKSTRSAILSPLSASVSVLSKGGSEAPRADTSELFCRRDVIFLMRYGAEILGVNRIFAWWSIFGRLVIVFLAAFPFDTKIP